MDEVVLMMGVTQATGPSWTGVHNTYGEAMTVSSSQFTAMKIFYLYK